MRLRLSSHVAAVVACFVALPAYADKSEGSNGSDAAAAGKSVTVFPIILNSGKPIEGVAPDMSKNLAEMIGLLLERGGVKDVEIADSQFSPPEKDKDDLAKLAEAFGQFVQTRKLSTEYALYGQFFGTPGKGVEEIRLVVVDRQGKVVLSERRAKRQLSSFGEGKVDPMAASYNLVRRLDGILELTDPNEKDAPEGKMAKLFAEKSGLPTKAERQAMTLRLKGLKEAIKTSTIAVFPVSVSGKSDDLIAGRLAAMLTEKGLGQAKPTGVDPKLDIKPNTNQARIAWDTAKAFQSFLRKNPPTADYAMFVAYGIAQTHDGKTMVGGVQFVLCDRKGDWILVVLRNSHQPDYQRINPQSADDCNRVVVEAMASELR